MKRFLEEARRIVRMNSVSIHGNEEIANYAATLMQDRGIKVQLQHVTHSNEDFSKRQFNVLGILGDSLVDRKIRQGLLLSTHLDTVSPGMMEQWTDTGGDPFAATIKNGNIHGLGTADAKLDFLCKLHAIEKFREKKLKTPIYLVGTCGSGIGMFGARYLIKSLSLNPKFVLLGEPTDLKVVHAHKVLNTFRISISYQVTERDPRGFNRRIDLFSLGRANHSATPEYGTNAILAVVDFLHSSIEKGFKMRFVHLDGGDVTHKVPDHAIAQFYLTSGQFEDFKRFFREFIRSQEGTQDKTRAFKVELGGVSGTGVRFLPDQLFPCLTDIVNFFRNTSLEFEKKRDESYSPPYSTVSLRQVKQKPNNLEILFDMYLLPDQDVSQIEKEILKGMTTIAHRYPNLSMTSHREHLGSGLNMLLEEHWMIICREALEKANLPVSFGKKSTFSEAALHFQAGYPSAIFGPGLSEDNSHSPNEHAMIEQLEKAILFYEKIIEGVCL